MDSVEWWWWLALGDGSQQDRVAAECSGTTMGRRCIGFACDWMLSLSLSVSLNVRVSIVRECECDCVSLCVCFLQRGEEITYNNDEYIEFRMRARCLWGGETCASPPIG